MTFSVGQHVIAINAFGKLLKGSVARVPADWSDGHSTTTNRGAFPKAWIRLDATGHTVPWPLEDVFTDLAAAKRRQTELADRRQETP